jgi:hypothetical protein
MSGVVEIMSIPIVLVTWRTFRVWRDWKERCRGLHWMRKGAQERRDGAGDGRGREGGGGKERDGEREKRRRGRDGGRGAAGASGVRGACLILNVQIVTSDRVLKQATLTKKDADVGKTLTIRQHLSLQATNTTQVIFNFAARTSARDIQTLVWPACPLMVS